jgi:L-seryl-tRNA(Ser) seleniumtransferase
LIVSWDPKQIGLTAGEVGRLLLEGEPRIMSHASGDGSSFLIRPVAMRPDDHKAVAQRLQQIFRSAPKGATKAPQAAPAADVTGRWDVDVQYDAGSATHKVFLEAKGNRLSGTHIGWAYEGTLKGSIDGDRVEFRSSLPVGGQRLSYTFSGRLADDVMSGEVQLGEYGSAKWSARRHNAA